DVPSGAIPRPDAAKQVAAAPKAQGSAPGAPRAKAPTQQPKPGGPRPAPRPTPRPLSRDAESLSALLEPDQNGVRQGSGGGGKGLIICLVLLIVAGGAGAVLHFVTHTF